LNPILRRFRVFRQQRDQDIRSLDVFIDRALNLARREELLDGLLHSSSSPALSLPHFFAPFPLFDMVPPFRAQKIRSANKPKYKITIPVESALYINPAAIFDTV
jgi:hypothetical protein